MIEWVGPRAVRNLGGHPSWAGIVGSWPTSVEAAFSVALPPPAAVLSPAPGAVDACPEAVLVVRTDQVRGHVIVSSVKPTVGV